jgi:Outer membrane protein beta-barrel domain
MRHSGLIALAIALLAVLPATAALGETGFYVGGSLGQSSERFDPSAYNVRAQNTGYQVTAGWRPIDLFAGEVDYVGFGRAHGGVNYADTDGEGIFALGFLPIPLVDVYGRLGLMNWRTDVTSPFRSFHRSGADLAYGVGAGMHWGSLGARLEYERFDVSATSTMSLTSIGMTWTFL